MAVYHAPAIDAFGHAVLPGDIVLFSKMRGKSSRMMVGIAVRTTESSVVGAMICTGLIEKGKKRDFTFRETRILGLGNVVKLTDEAVISMGLEDLIRPVQEWVLFPERNPNQNGLLFVVAEVHEDTKRPWQV